MNKNYGPSVLGYLDPDLRSFELAVFQTGKPVLDKELNLNEDIATSLQRKALSETVPSGWISQDFLGTSDHSNFFVYLSPISGNSNKLSLVGPLRANVNGWLLTVDNTSQNGGNLLTLPAPPVTAGSQRTDVVILEVWRLLLAPSPSAVGKSTLGRIWRNGNVKVASANDAALNPADDILDGTVGSETTKRVQIQYRLRVISGVDLFSYPFGMDDPTVVANSVPTNATTPDGISTAFAYVRQSANGDPGLWLAGDGNPANSLGTVDGYMYAIPLCGVLRLNSSAYSKNSNQRGSSVSPGGSTDRPDTTNGGADSIYPQIVNERDIVDLRQGISLTGWNYQELLDKNLTYLLDNTLKTEVETTAGGGGFSGHTLLSADEVGLLPGDSVTTGSTPAGNFKGQFDSVRRSVSDRPLFEVMVVQVSPGGPTWANGDVVTINGSSLAVYPNPGTTFNFLSRAPAGTLLMSVVGARFIGNGSAGKHSLDATLVSITGEGSGSISLKIGELPSDLTLHVTDEKLYVSILVAYPPGQGLTKTPNKLFKISTNNPGSLPGNFGSFISTVDVAHREPNLEYLTNGTDTFTLSAEFRTSTTTVVLPERVASIGALTVNSVARSFTIDDTGRILTLGTPTTSPTDVIAMTGIVYRRSVAQNTIQVAIYYEGRANQSVRSQILGTSLSVVPRYISSKLTIVTAGSGSQGTAFPFPTAYCQLGGVNPASLGVFAGEHDLFGPAQITLNDFNASTGMLRLSSLIDYTPNPEQVEFTRAPTDSDIENRSYFPTASGGSLYDPSAYAVPLSQPARHKVVLPIIVETVADSPIGPKGLLLMMVIMRWAIFDANNNVAFDPTTSINTTTASVYRLKGNLLNLRT